MVDLTVDLGDTSAPIELEFRPFSTMFLHIGGGATPDIYKYSNQLLNDNIIKELY